MEWAPILAVTAGTAGSDAAMVAAIDLGQRFGAPVDFLHVANDPRALMPYVGAGMSGIALEQVMTSVEPGTNQRRATVKARFKRLFSYAGLPQIGPEQPVSPRHFSVSYSMVAGPHQD